MPTQYHAAPAPGLQRSQRKAARGDLVCPCKNPPVQVRQDRWPQAMVVDRLLWEAHTLAGRGLHLKAAAFVPLELRPGSEAPGRLIVSRVLGASRLPGRGSISRASRQTEEAWGESQPQAHASSCSSPVCGCGGPWGQGASSDIDPLLSVGRPGPLWGVLSEACY